MFVFVQIKNMGNKNEQKDIIQTNLMEGGENDEPPLDNVDISSGWLCRMVHSIEAYLSLRQRRSDPARPSCFFGKRACFMGFVEFYQR